MGVFQSTDKSNLSLYCALVVEKKKALTHYFFPSFFSSLECPPLGHKFQKNLSVWSDISSFWDALSRLLISH